MKGPKRAWIVIAEPSPFRRAETHVLGPFKWWFRAAFAAWYYVQIHPFAECRVVAAACKVLRGRGPDEETLWDGVGKFAK